MALGRFRRQRKALQALESTAARQFTQRDATPLKCRGWINLCSVVDELRPLISVRVYCAVPAGEKHPTDGNGDPLHWYRSIYWGARSVPEESD